MPLRPPAAALRRVLGPFAALYRVRRAATAVEFGLVATPLLMLLVGSASFAYVFYLQFALDYSLQQAVRQVQLGNVAGSTTSTNFISGVMCPIFSQFASCTGLQVSVQQVSDYLTSYSTITSSAQPTAFCTGQPGTLMFARAIYQAPVWARFMVFTLPPSPSSSGQNVVSAVAFANENPSGSTVVGTAGC